MPYADPIKRKEYHTAYNKRWYQKAKNRYSGICPVCSKRFTTRYKEQTTCSLKCSGVYRRHKQICKTCGKSFRCFPYKKQKYCSRECWGIKRRVVGKCKTCGKKTFSQPSRIKTYCSTKCMFNDPAVKKRAKELYLTSNTPERRRKTIERLKSWTGNKNPAWKGGVTKLHCKIRASSEYKEWRTAVFARDDYMCILCGAKNGDGGAVYLEAHHMVPFSQLLNQKNWDLMWDVDNGRTLCKECHKKTDTYAKQCIR